MIPELIDLYADPALDLPPLEVTFRDYALAARQIEGSELYARAKAYWMARIPVLPPAPDLPLRQPPAMLDRPVNVRRAHRITTERWERIKARGAAAGITPSMIVLSVYAQVLGRWSRSSSFLANVTVSNRLPLHPAIDGVVGDFTTIELLEVDLREQRGLDQLAGALQQRLWQDLEHRYFGGVDVLRELARIRGGGVLAAPFVFTSTLGFNMDAVSNVTYMVTQTAQVLIDHQAVETGEGVMVSWDCVEAAFPERMLDEMFDAYSGYLEGLADEEGLWDGTTRYDWLAGAAPAVGARAHLTPTPLRDEVLHGGFLTQAAGEPDRVALVWPGGSMTYGELAQKASQLAGRLRALEVKPNTLVGVGVADRRQQAVAVIGVLMAGGAYLPIDPGLADERRRELVEQAQLGIVVTAQEASSSWPDHVSQVPVLHDADELGDGELPVQALPAPGDLAYVLYSSDSTDTPRGVPITHRAACNTILDVNDRFDVGPADRVLALASLSCDLSVYDLFGILAAGGALVFPQTQDPQDARQWLELCEADQVTIWNSPPALIARALEQGESSASQSSSLRLVLLSREQVPLALPNRIRMFAKQAQVVSLAGATEAAIWSSYQPVDDIDPAWPGIPYGQPLRNQFYEVLNDRLELCPPGVPGDLYIGGSGLADGYWRDEAHAIGAFTNDPDTGERLYRTGEVGRYLPDGNIEFLGAEDSQVTIGGHRFALGEIEAQLSAHPQVRMAAVAAARDAEDRQRLVAYVVPEADMDSARRARETAAASQSVEPGVSMGEAHATSYDADGVLVTDPLERLEFKLRRHGLRRLEGPAPAIDLPPAGSSEERKLLNDARRSRRAFRAQPVPVESLSSLLEALRSSVNESGLPKHRYGSAGALYPVQAYIGVGQDRVRGVPGGTYYYDPEAHALRCILPGVSLGTGVHADANAHFVAQSAFTIVLVGEMDAIEPLYGAHAERFSLIEAGLITQTLEVEASRCGIGLCQVSMADAPALRELLALRENHRVLHGLVGGGLDSGDRCNGNLPAADHAGLWAELGEWLAKKLALDMVPDAFVATAELPLTPDGRLDRNRLSEMAASDSGTATSKRLSERGLVSDESAVAALGSRLAATRAKDHGEAVLEIVRAALATVLGEDVAGAIEPTRPFAEVGLDSLQAVRLRNELEAATGLRLPATVVFDHPTPMLVAERVLELTAASGGEDAVPDAGELAQIEQRLRLLATHEPERENIVARLRALVNAISVEAQDEADTDLAEASAENLIELIDRELDES